VHHHRRFGDAEAGAAKRFRDADAKPAVGRQRAMEVFREFAVAVARQPVIVAKARADFFDRVAQGLLEL
jgi:hypothetical protein